MSKIYALILTTVFIFFGSSAISQCSTKVNATITTPTLSGGSNYTKTAAVFNPVNNVYYTVNGNAIQTHNSSGTLLNSFYAYRVRGLWWNSSLGQLESNSYYTAGIKSYTINSTTGYVTAETTVFSGTNHQPNYNSQGVYDDSSDEIYYYYYPSFYRYSRATGLLLGTVAISGLPTSYSLPANNIIYTGCSGKELGLYNRSTREILLFNKSTGAYVTSSQLPVGAPVPSNYGVSYTNDKLMITDGFSWFSYDIINLGLQTSSITGPFCDSSNVSVNFSLNTATFNTGNIFTAQLSDANGSFSSPITLGSITDTVAGTISGIIPANTTPGGNYRIRVVSTNPVKVGQDNGTNITINVLAVNLGPDISFCPGDSSVLTAPVGVYSYNWSSGATTPSLIVTTAGTYQVTVSNGVCSTSDTINTTLLTAPSPSLSDTVTVCANSTVLNPGSFVSYIWSNGGTSSTITANSTGLYSVTVTGSNTCTSIDSTFVNLLKPEISTGDTAICVGDTLDMSTASGCYFVLSSIENTSAYNTDSYYAAGDDRGGMAVTQNYLYYTGDNYTARYNTNLTSYTSLSQRDGIFSDLSSGQLYTFWSTTYNGFTSSSTYTQSISAIRTMDASLNYTGSVINLSQTINAGYGSYVFAGSGLVVLWSNMDQHFYKIELPSGSVTDLGTYNLYNARYSSENWASWGVVECNGSDYSFVFRANTNSTFGTSNTEITRFNLSNSTFSTASSFTNFNLGQIACITYSPWNNRWYYQSEYSSGFGTLNENIGYAAANHNGVGGSNSINDYSWSTGATTPVISISPTSTSNYSVTVSHGSVSCSDTVTVTVNALPSMTLSDTMTFCNLDSVQISSPGSYSSYLWSTGAVTSSTYVSIAGYYDLQVSNASNCYAKDSMYVNLLDARIDKNDTTLCSADSLQLFVGASSCGFQLQTMSITNKYSVYNRAGSQNGGIAITPNYVYTNGNTYCSRYSPSLNTYTNFTRRDGIFSDLSSGQLYTFWSTSSNAFSYNNYSSYTTINAIRRMDESLNIGTTLMLSQTINAGSNSFVAAGTGFVLLWAQSNNTLYRIDLFTGNVENLGVQNTLGNGIHFYNGWASYGIAECTANGYSVVAHIDNNLGTGSYNSIGRFSLATNSWTEAAPTVNAYSGMSDITYSKWNNKWYFAHAYSRSGLGSYSPSIGYADATSSVSGGNYAGSGYVGSFLWSTSDTISSIVVNPSASTDYSITVTNGSHSCTDTVSVTVIQSPTVTETVSALSCYGDTNSSASLAVTGGTTPYIYAWSTGGNTNSLTNISAGSYLYTVTGNNSCEIIDSIIVTSPTEIISTDTVSTNASCFTSTDGTAFVTVTGGTPGYTYLWPSGTTTATDANVSGGWNIVTITDANSCVVYDSVFMLSPAKIDSAGPITSTTTFYCPGTTGTLVAANSGVGAITRAYNHITATKNPTPNYYSLMSFSFPSVPRSAITGATLKVHFKGDFNSSSEYLYLYDENGVSIGSTYYPYYGNCSSYTTTTLSLSLAQMQGWLADGVLSFGATPNSNVFGGTSCPTVVYMELTFDYLENVKTYWFATISTDTNQALGSGGTLGVTPTTTTTYYAANFGDGCNSTFDSITVIVPPAPSTVYIMNPTSICAGETTAIQAYGAASYTWPNDPTITGSGATVSITPTVTTDYMVTITNAFSCSYVDTVNIPVSPSPLGNVLTTNNTSCSNANDGQAAVYATGGISPYTYNWSNGSSGALQLNLSAGTYIITITGANSCVDTMSVIVGGPVPMEYNATVNDITCNGSGNGSISLAVTGGNAPYSYLWSGGQTTASISGLSSGSYAVTVTDNTTCTADTTFTISEPMLLLATISGTTPESCAGLSNGSITSVTTGGTSPYTYIWGNGSTTSMLTSIPGGIYNLTVTDANGCTSSTSGTVITTPTTLALNTGGVSDVLCYNGNDGSALATATGGVSPYSYNWSNGDASANLLNAAAGTYSVTVTDGNSCQDVSSVTVSEPTQLMVTNNVVTNVSCFGLTDASATVSVTGGVTGYNYLWPDNSTLSANLNLSSGTTIVTVTDANNCTDTTSILVTEPSEITLSPTVTDISCNGLTDGSITTAVSGGTAAYTYAWSTLASSIGISGLATGSYSVTVTDANSCTADSSFTIAQPITMAASIVSSTNVACYGSTTGDATADAIGGTMPYSFAWSNASNNALNDNLIAGTYEVTVTDANGCFDTSIVTLTEPATLLSVSLTDTVNILCNSGSNGSIRAVATNGGNAYAYAWSNGSTDSVITNLVAGSYTVSVTDSYGCMITDSVTITEPSALTLFLGAKSDVTCFGTSDGSASIFVSGGTSTYTYEWSNSSTSSSISSVGPGIYTFTVTDVNSCQDSATVTITEPTALTVNISNSQNVACNGNATGFAVVEGNGGTSPYNYVWSTGSTTDSIYNQASGFYGVTITDGNGCIDSALANLTQPTSMLVSVASSTNNVCFGDALGQGQIAVTGGAIPYSYAWPSGASTVSVSNLVAGSHIVTVTDNNNCQDTTVVTITEPLQLMSTISSQTNMLCYGDQNGSVSVNVTGGTASYSYLWSNGVTDTLITNLGANTYSVTITDNNGCMDSLTTIVTEPSALTSSLTVANALCNSDTNGTINAIVSGGTLPFNFSWSTGDTTTMIANLGANSYSVTITDGNGCTDTLSANVTEPIILINTLQSSTQVNCNGGFNGTATTATTGGTTPYSFLWSGGQNVESPINLGSGLNTLIVTDANGCTDTTSTTLNSISNLDLSLVSVSDILCNGDSSANITVSATGGIGANTYSWSVTGTDSTLLNQPAGNYFAYVTDNSNCSDTLSITVTDPSLITPYSIAHQNPLCFGEATGRVEVSAVGGVGTYSYLWPSGNSTSIDSTLVAGIHTVTVTDSNSCSITYDVYLTEPTKLLNPAFIISDVRCATDKTGRITMSPSGGTMPYSYLWSNGATGNIITNVRAGDYQVTVTDDNGCQLHDTAVVNSTFIETLSQLPNDTSVCGGTLTLTANASFNSYNWSTGANGAAVIISQSGLITFTGVDGNGCITYDTLEVKILPAISFDLGADVNTICEGTNYVIDAGSGYVSYNWSNGDTTSTTTVSTTGTYFVEIVDTSLCHASDQINVNMLALPVIDLGADTIGCIDLGVSNILLDAGTGFKSYLWSTGATSQIENVITDGDYSVVVENANGCKNSDTINVTFDVCSGINDPESSLRISMYPNPTRGDLTIDLKGFLGQTVEIEILSTDGHLIRQIRIESNNQSELQTQIDLNDVAQGLYFVVVRSGDEVKIERITIY